MVKCGLRASLLDHCIHFFSSLLCLFLLLSTNAHTHCHHLNHQLPIQFSFMSADMEWLSSYWKLLCIGQLFSASPAPLAFRKKQDDYYLCFSEREKISLDYLKILQTLLQLSASVCFLHLPSVRVCWENVLWLLHQLPV